MDTEGIKYTAEVEKGLLLSLRVKDRSEGAPYNTVPPVVKTKYLLLDKLGGKDRRAGGKET